MTFHDQLSLLHGDTICWIRITSVNIFVTFSKDDETFYHEAVVVQVTGDKCTLEYTPHDASQLLDKNTTITMETKALEFVEDGITRDTKIVKFNAREGISKMPMPAELMSEGAKDAMATLDLDWMVSALRFSNACISNNNRVTGTFCNCFAECLTKNKKNQIYKLHALILRKDNHYGMSMDCFFRAQEPKAPVTYCDHALSGVRPSSVRLSVVR